MEDRNEKLQSYVRRLSEGEDLESVRKDFVENFKDVDAAEIMKAEQDLMKNGVSYRDVQKLCDVHSALFHGATREEKIANAEKAVNDSLKKQNEGGAPGSGAVSGGAAAGAAGGADPAAIAGKAMQGNARSEMTMLSMIAGHPVNVFTKENNAIQKKIGEIREVLESDASYGQKKAKFAEIRPLSIHYSKKGDLLYPLLNSRYGISGPSQVMWGVDDEIRDEISTLCKKDMQPEEWQARAEKVLTRAEEMIYKEQNILLPICVQSFSEEEWKQMARDLQDYDPCLTDRIPMWREASVVQGRPESSVTPVSGSQNAAGSNAASEPAGEPISSKTGVPSSGSDTSDVFASLQNSIEALQKQLDQLKAGQQAKDQAEEQAQQKKADAAQSASENPTAAAAEEGEIVLPSGHFTKAQLRAMLNTIPLEISFVDDKDINRYFNEGPKVFKRPLAALDREVYYCHPPKVEEMVRMMITQFRNGTRKSFEVWMEKQGRTFLVRYLAVYDENGKFVGTMEVVEDMEGAKQHFTSPAAAAKKAVDENPEW